jgi:hypothetical protein
MAPEPQRAEVLSYAGTLSAVNSWFAYAIYRA